jgi:ubiquinone/menaquinone biosynthesis C-methylase UbiE
MEPMASCTKDGVGSATVTEWRGRVFQFNRSLRDQWVREQASLVPPGAQVLDVGAGRGPYRRMFSHCDYKAHDFAAEPNTVGHYTSLDYCTDILSLPVPNERFDVVLCTEVLEHVPEPIAAVREMARVLKPGGLLLVSSPLGSELHQDPFHYYGGYTPHWYRRFLPAAGIEIENIAANRGFFSYFAQEGQRFSTYLNPRRVMNSTRWWPLLTLLWVATLPLLRFILPLLAEPLDRLCLERTCTVGYHVSGRKRAA